MHKLAFAQSLFTFCEQFTNACYCREVEKTSFFSRHHSYLGNVLVNSHKVKLHFSMHLYTRKMHLNVLDALNTSIWHALVPINVSKCMCSRTKLNVKYVQILMRSATYKQ